MLLSLGSAKLSFIIVMIGIVLLASIAAELMQNYATRRVNSELLKEVATLNGSHLDHQPVSFWSTMPGRFFTILLCQSLVLGLIWGFFPSYIADSFRSWQSFVYPLITSAILASNGRS